MKEALNTEPSAVAPDATVNFVVEQIAEHVKVQLITSLTLASGATALGSVNVVRISPRLARHPIRKLKLTHH
jgi:hypothetical protein